MFARWMLPKVGKKGLQEGVKTIKSFNPKKLKFKGKSADDLKIAASAAKIKQASFNYQAGIGKAMRKMKDIKSK